MVCEFDESGHITVYLVIEFETPIYFTTRQC